VYENHVTGSLTVKLFLQLSNGYDTQQKECLKLITRLEKEIDQQE